MLFINHARYTWILWSISGSLPRLVPSPWTMPVAISPHPPAFINLSASCAPWRSCHLSLCTSIGSSSSMSSSSGGWWGFNEIQPMAWQLHFFSQRLVTCFFYLGTFSLPYCWNTWVLVRDGKVGRSSDVPHICDSKLQNVAEEVDVLEQTFPVRYTIAPRWKKWPFKENRPSTCGCWSVAQARCKALLCWHGSCSCQNNMQQLTFAVERYDFVAHLLVWEPVRRDAHQIGKNADALSALWLRLSAFAIPENSLTHLATCSSMSQFQDSWLSFWDSYRDPDSREFWKQPI